MIQVLTGGATQKDCRSCYSFSGNSAVWLAHLLWEQRVGGSNPSCPTILSGFQSRFAGVFDPKNTPSGYSSGYSAGIFRTSGSSGNALASVYT